MPEPLARPDAVFYSKARHALYAAVEALGLKPGETILLPAYLFPSVAEPFRLRGMRLAFYRIDRSFQCDLEDMERRLKETGAKAVMVIHYFGFPQPVAAVKALTGPLGVALIEDAAHALLSEADGHTLGTEGDIGIFCLHKGLGLPDGGALILNTPSLRVPAKPEGINRSGVFFNFVKKGSSRVEARLGWSWRPFILRSKKLRHRAYHLEGMLGIADNRAMAPLSLRLMQGLPYTEIQMRRRKNFDWYRRSLKGLAHCAQPMGDLPTGVCPFGYPLLVDRRDELVRWLLGRGINCQVLWEVLDPDVALEEFPDTEYLLKHNLLLPLHQDIDQRACERVVGALRQWFASLGEK
jgi:dTDP-4-amino-4,6-dideoxygalactose transaminase